MKNTFGNSMAVTIFGESHGAFIGATLDGLAPGIEIDEEFIRHNLSLRRPSGKISTQRVEADEFQIVSGVYQGKTTGTPLTVIIPNNSQHSADYENAARAARPGHADYTAHVKYKGYEDFRGGGHFSGRITAALVAAGAIVIPELKKKGVNIGTHILSCGGIKDRDLEDYDRDIAMLSDMEFPVLSKDSATKIREMMEQVASEGDSVGGILETVVTGLPAGLGEPWFDSVESIISHGLFSIPAIKGVEFGDAFSMVNGRGSEYNDPLRMEKGRVVTKTNNNAGINGGITNGMPLLFRCAVKPTPSIYKKQETIDLNSNENTELEIKGRHDPAIIHRARIVVDSLTALVIYDICASKFGTDYFGGH